MRLSGFTSTPMRRIRGSASLKRSSRFELISGLKNVDPVMFPPGRARLDMMRVPNYCHDNRNGRGCALGCKDGWCAMRDEDIDVETNQPPS
jgi:hypothetical protein